MDPLTDAERQRYARHLSIPGIGEEGQLILKNRSVLLIGTGGLGSPAALYLAAAGLGRLGLIDPDHVSLSNLQRQILHRQSTLGQPKLQSATTTLQDLNPHLQIETHPDSFHPDNALDLLAQYDLLIDGSDNFPTRFLSNDAAFFAKKPLIYGSIFRFEGQMTVFAPHLGSPCYRCLLPSLPPPEAAPNCAEAGVLGTLPGIIGTLQAMEALKILLNLGTPPLGKLLTYDALETSFRTLTLPPDPHCPLCGPNPTITSVKNPQTLAPHACFPSQEIPSITAAQLRALLPTGITLIDVRQPAEHALNHIPGSQLIPLPDLPNHFHKLPRDQKIYLHCQSGQRSAQATTLLHQNGFPLATNLQGGLDAWLAEQ